VSEHSSFLRKIMYGCAIVVLLLPLSWLSQPATTKADAGGGAGGKLAQLRDDYKLSQANIGLIDPASETMKLATLGLRGVAANLLWEKAIEYKKKEDWTGLSATLEQITHLQPNFIAVWRFQAWNLSYNVSVEFDDYHNRYYWVIKGINFLKEGKAYNSEEPRLQWDIGWFIAQKIGRADEHKQYRRLFREDDDFNGSLPRSQRDNWLVGRTAFLDAQKMVDTKGIQIKGMSPLLFHDNPAKCMMNYAETLEDEGTHGEVAQNAWRKAGEEWDSYGARDLPTTYDLTIRLNDQELYERNAKAADEELEALAPGVKERLRKEKMKSLSKKERQAVELPEKDRSVEQAQLAQMCEDRIRPSANEIADHVKGADHAAALRIADAATNADFIAGVIDRYREVVNFKYWRLRCKAEQTADAVKARKLIFDGDRTFAAADLDGAVRQYDEGLQQWRKVLDAFPDLIAESAVVDDLMDVINHYRDILAQHNRQLPDDFVLQDVIDRDSANMNIGVPPKPKEKDQQPPGTPGSPTPEPEPVPKPKS